MRHLKYLNKYFLKYKYHFFLGILFVALQNIFAVIPPRIIRYAFDMVRGSIANYQLIDGFQQQANYQAVIGKGLLLFGLLVIGLAIVRGIFMFLMRHTIVVMSRHIEFDLKNEIYNHYQKLDTAFYKKNNTGDLMNRVTDDVSKVRMYLGPAVLYSINLVVRFVLVIGTMLTVNGKLTFYVLLPLPLLSLSIYYVNSIINRKSEKIQRQLSNLTSIAQESFSGIRVIKSYVQEKPILNYFANESEQYMKDSLSLARVNAFFHPLMILLIGLSTVLTIYIGGIEVAKGNISAGNIAEFVIYVNMLTWPVTSLGWVASIIQRASASQERINQFLLTDSSIVSTENTNVNFNGQLIYKNVHFTYPDSGIKAISDLSFTINSGEKVAIIGKTGSGKSTIADLLLRMYDIDSGEISISGDAINSMNVNALRGEIGYVPQDVFLFSDTVLNNVQFGVKDASFESVKQATKTACIYNEIMSLPNQFNAMVGERGVTLSGGQKQRISIARAILKDSPIIIFDDCLSAVDAKTEQTILANLRETWKQKTIIFITHRIFSVMDFDKIIVIDNGTVVDSGVHNKLLNKKGIYHELFISQQNEEKQTSKTGI